MAGRPHLPAKALSAPMQQVRHADARIAISHAPPTQALVRDGSQWEMRVHKAPPSIRLRKAWAPVRMPCSGMRRLGPASAHSDAQHKGSSELLRRPLLAQTRALHGHSAGPLPERPQHPYLDPGRARHWCDSLGRPLSASSDLFHHVLVANAHPLPPAGDRRSGPKRQRQRAPGDHFHGPAHQLLLLLLEGLGARGTAQRDVLRRRRGLWKRR